MKRFASSEDSGLRSAGYVTSLSRPDRQGLPLRRSKDHGADCLTCVVAFRGSIVPWRSGLGCPPCHSLSLPNLMPQSEKSCPQEFPL